MGDFRGESHAVNVPVEELRKRQNSTPKTPPAPEKAAQPAAQPQAVPADPVPARLDDTLTDEDGESLSFQHPKAKALAGELNRQKAAGKDTSAAEVAMGNVHGMEDGLSDRDHKRLVARRLASAHRDAVRLGKADAAGVADDLLTGEHVGAERIGKQGETVPFDPVHHESDGSVSTGTPVTVERHGHRIDEGNGREYVVGKAKVKAAPQAPVATPTKPEDAESEEEFEARLKREAAERRASFKERRAKLLADPKFAVDLNEGERPKSEKAIERPKDRPLTEAELERQARERIDANLPAEGEDGPTAADLKAAEGEADAAVKDASGEYADPTKPVVGQAGKTATEQVADEKAKRIAAMQAKVAAGKGLGGEDLSDEDRAELADTDAEDQLDAQPVLKKAGRKRLADNTSAPFANRLTTNKGGGAELAARAAKEFAASGKVPAVPEVVRKAFANASDKDKLDTMWSEHVKQLAGQAKANPEPAKPKKVGKVKADTAGGVADGGEKFDLDEFADKSVGGHSTKRAVAAAEVDHGFAAALGQAQRRVQSTGGVGDLAELRAAMPPEYRGDVFDSQLLRLASDRKLKVVQDWVPTPRTDAEKANYLTDRHGSLFTLVAGLDQFAPEAATPKTAGKVKEQPPPESPKTGGYVKSITDEQKAAARKRIEPAMLNNDPKLSEERDPFEDAAKVSDERVNQVAPDILAAIRANADRTTVGPATHDLYESVAEKHGLSPDEFRGVMRKLADAKKVKFSMWGKTMDELPRPDLAMPVRGTVMAYAHPGEKFDEQEDESKKAGQVNDGGGGDPAKKADAPVGEAGAATAQPVTPVPTVVERRKKDLLARAENIPVTDGEYSGRGGNQSDVWLRYGSTRYLDFDTAAGKYMIESGPASLPIGGGQDAHTLLFRPTGGGGDGYKITGAGSAHEVFSKVTAAVTSLVSKTNPPALFFSAAEPSRAKLYDRMVASLGATVPGYEAYSVDTPDGGKKYMLVKPEYAAGARKQLEKQSAVGSERKPIVKVEAKPLTLLGLPAIDPADYLGLDG
jgi:hypothetical protein